MLSVIVPASNEEAWLPACLDALAAQTLDPDACGGIELVISANACRDGTVAVARSRAADFAARGWRLEVIDSPEPGKPGALNRADAVARGDMRAYLDADVMLDPALLAEVVAILDTDAPRYASGRLRVARARSAVTRHFAAIWSQLPFMTEGVPGAGFFAVNAAGRARWDAFPDIISDDTYVRLLFTPPERYLAEAGYDWPMTEGAAGLVKVRRRQDAGVREIARLYPHLMANEGKARLGALGMLRLAVQRPTGFALYCWIVARARIGMKRQSAWTRGR